MLSTTFEFITFDSAHRGSCPVSARPQAPAPFIPGTPYVPETPAAPDAPAMPLVVDMQSFREASPAALERHFWSQGRPALPGAPRPPRREEYDPAEMSLDHLIATQRDGSNLPSVARAAWLAGADVRSADMPATDDGTDTLAETVPADNPYYSTLQTIIDPADMTPEQRAAYEAFCAEFAGRGRTAYVIEDPAIRQRIEWERFARASSATSRFGVRPNRAGDAMEFYALTGTRLSREEFLAAKQRFVADFLARTGLDAMPTFEEFQSKRALYPALRESLTVATQAAQADALDLALHEIEQEQFEDLEAATSVEAVDEPYIPSLALIVYQHQQREEASGRIRRWSDFLVHLSPAQRERYVESTIRREAMAEYLDIVHAALGDEDDPDAEPVELPKLFRWRSVRDALRHRFGSRDALYHTTLPEEEVDAPVVSIGA